MPEPKPAVSASFPRDNPPGAVKRFVGEFDLRWFGASLHSDVATGVQDGDRLAIKRLFRPRGRCRFSEQLLESALKEWESVAVHPNIQIFLGLLPANSHSTFPMLVTPYVAWNLMDYIQEKPTADKTTLAYDVASAIAYMHAQNPPITHGNLKASNVLVDETGAAYVSDIGIREALSVPGQLEYELRWTAPERVLKNQRHNTECDVWSFGMTVLEMHTGYHPFQNYPNDASVVLAMEEEQIPPRPQNNEVFNEKIWTLLNKCWSYTPSQRPSVVEILPQIAPEGKP